MSTEVKNSYSDVYHFQFHYLLNALQSRWMVQKIPICFSFLFVVCDGSYSRIKQKKKQTKKKKIEILLSFEKKF